MQVHRQSLNQKNLDLHKEMTRKDYEDMKRGVMEEVRRIFKPEFLNRVDEIMVFHLLENGNSKDCEYSVKELENDAKNSWIFS